jgi:alpha-glucosidase (family GH31 glycosyl hydrolase)
MRAWLIPLLLVSCHRAPAPTSPRVAFDRGGQRLVIEVVADDLVHFELAPADRPFDPTRRIARSPMLLPASGPPARFERAGRRIKTAELTIEVGDDLCVSVSRRAALTRMCPSRGALTIDPYPGQRGAVNAYGLGQACVEPGLSGGDWSGRVRRPGSSFGNRMEKFDGGACGNTQIPILYALGTPPEPFALFVDQPRAQTWDLRRRPWRVRAEVPALRWFLLGADTLPELRADYLALSGRPPVPPRAAFGLWVSEYGYDDWAELEEILAALRARGFPVDGFILDLQWFGGIREGAEDTSMGRLAFDTAKFPDPAGTIAKLREQAIGIIPIEESYIGRGLAEHATLAAKGYLARTRTGEPVYLAAEPWWGKGGMIDWSNRKAGDAWHDWKRKPLVDLGVVGHWTDLGEPEQFDPAAVYAGFAGIGRDQAAVHNLYNLAWAESIARGYRRHREARRPFILTRSGTAGIQRTGAALWSGDLASRFTTLASQQRNRVHMVMSGIDYYGSDIGGFQRVALGGGDVDDLYTRWLASAALSELPVRPHTYNLEEKHETSPDRIGHLASNLAAVRLRYQLVPFLYSLAHRAHQHGEPVFPPLFFYYPADLEARGIGDQTMIGADLLAAMAIEPGQKTRRVYLPAGAWYHFHDGRRIDSAGQWLEAPLEREGVLELPLYARAGAIIPIARVHADTLGTSGRRRGAAAANEIAVRVFAGADGEFTLVEDDGETVEYLEDAIRLTTIRQGRTWIEIGAGFGQYRGAPATRAVWLEIVGSKATAVRWGKDSLARHPDLAALEKAGQGWVRDGSRLLVALPERPVSEVRRVILVD